jgi:isoleucyl-tRNA synthetase
MDIWIDSGLVWSYFKQPIYMSVEGEDQYRCWWQVSTILSYFSKTYIPNKILVHPYIIVNEETQEKISKSFKNFISMDELLAKYPNDVLRLNFCSSN